MIARGNLVIIPDEPGRRKNTFDRKILFRPYQYSAHKQDCVAIIAMPLKCTTIA